ncbi:Bacterial sugar transferase domain-containing protein [Candidatus Magnetomoraceae bacterium gMMP-13]
MKHSLLSLGSFAIYIIIDFVTIAFSVMASYKIYRYLELGKYAFYPKLGIISVSMLFSLIVVIILFLSGAYKNESSLLNVSEIKSVVQGISLAFLLLAAMLVFTKTELSRYVLAFSYICSLSLVVIERIVLYHFFPLIKNWNRRILIYGAGELGAALFREITNSPRLGILPIGFIDDNPDKVNAIHRSSGFSSTSYILPVLGTGNDIGVLIKHYRIDEIFLAISNISNETCIKILEQLKKDNVKVSFIPNLYKVFVHRVNIRHIGQIPIVEEYEEEAGKIYLRMKRYSDILMAVMLMILLFPVLLVISATIKIDSKGPVFFRQKRVGINGRLFEIFKFRSMIAASDPYAVSPTKKNDLRITKVGKILRKTSLDELPQLFNVLKGDMSFVGPRPEMPFIVDSYSEIHQERLKVLPGITGLWQLSGDREKAIHENMDYDLYYIKNRCFLLDMVILLETLLFAFKGM